ncbi:MAG: hypothetical protein KDK78_10520, partial [Chlamydiia bacterium]|nr:hypothetical protein [Chlamydiia bacterium]
IIGMGHVLRKQVQEEEERDPTGRHLVAKVVRSGVHQGGGVRTVLGILVGVNFLKDNESLEERHILKAVQNYIPGAQVVEGSVVCSGTRGGDTSTLYVEIEKISGLDFTVEELHQLSKALPHDLRDRVEHMMHPIFMPRNEEEVMRNMLTLSNQIKYLRDIPQVMISFDEQTDTQLSFCVTMVRVLRQHSAPIPELIASTRCPVDFTCEASRVVGHVRRKYAKEATIIHVRLRKHRFLRRDNRIDLNKARQVVVEELEKVIGEFRDYNGGMISKQNELLCAVRDLLGDDLKHNDFLLENFFYSLNPVVMRTILEAEHLASLFKLLLRTLEDGFFDGGGSVMRSCALETAACAIVTADQPALRTALDRELKKINLRPLELATTFVNVYDTPRLGYILRSGDPARQRQFFEALELGVARFTGCVPAHSL